MNNQKNNIQPVNQQEETKKEYTSPELKKYGSLSELVQFNPGVGSDGGIADCSLS